MVTFSQFHVSSNFFESFVSVFISGVDDPSVCLHQHGWPEIVLWVPPVRWARRLTAGAQHALIKSIKQLSIFDCLNIFSVVFIFVVFPHKVWVDRFVLGIKVRHVGHQVLQYEHHHEGRDG